MELHDFGWALRVLKVGGRVTRSGWNGKSMWLAYMPGMTIPSGQVNTRTRKFLPEGDLTVGGYIVMFTAQGVWQPGWLASQMDLLAEDWWEVETINPENVGPVPDLR